MLEFVTIGDVKNYLYLNNSSYDSIINDIGISVEKAIKNYTGRNLRLSIHTDESYITNGNTSIIFLKDYPILDDPVPVVVYDSYTLVSDSDYEIDLNSGILRFLVTPPSAYLSKLKVTYTAGYDLAEFPADIQLVEKQIIATLFQSTIATKVNLDSQGNLSPMKKHEQIDTYKVDFVTDYKVKTLDELIKQNEAVLKLYKRVTL